jgi:hypothetical protein
MNPKIILCLALVLGGVSIVGSTAAQSSSKSDPWHGFPILPPIPNANPSIRHPILVLVPTKLKTEQTTESLSVGFDTNSLESTNLTVGANMLAGFQYEQYVYPAGEKRPAEGGLGLIGHVGGNYSDVTYWNTKRDGIPLPGKEYVVEMDLAVFETDIPPQHEWQPQGSKNYKILWKRTLKQTVLNTATFMQSILKKIEQQLPELASAGISAGTSSSAHGQDEAWHGEEYAAAGFILPNNPRYRPQDLHVTIHRFATSGEAQQFLEESLRWRQATPQPKERYKDATLYRYLGASGAVMTALCQAGQYIVEISPYSEGGIPLTMKVLDVVLAELDSTSSKSK